MEVVSRRRVILSGGGGSRAAGAGGGSEGLGCHHGRRGRAAVVSGLQKESPGACLRCQCACGLWRRPGLGRVGGGSLARGGAGRWPSRGGEFGGGLARRADED